MTRQWLSTMGLMGAVFALGAPLTASAQVPAPTWVKQDGAAMDDQAVSVATAGSDVFVVGRTSSQLGPEPRAGGFDVFVAKYDASGVRQWVHQLGTSEDERATAAATDAAGNVYLAGYTYGSFDIFTNAGGTDLFIAKYDPSGNLLWVKQRGTVTDDFATGLATGTLDTLYVAGYTLGDFSTGGMRDNYDAVVALYDTDGNPYWLQQVGSSSSDQATGIAVTPNHEVYVSGYTSGSLDGTTTPLGTDAFLMRFDITGTQYWARQIGLSSIDRATGVAVDGDGVAYLTGYTYGMLDGIPNAGIYDVFLARYDDLGNRLWSQMLGSTGPDYARGIAVAPDHSIAVAGTAGGAMPGSTYAGFDDTFVARFNAMGFLIGARNLGTADSEVNGGVAVDGSGAVYVTGYTYGTFPGNTPAGLQDFFLARFY